MAVTVFVPGNGGPLRGRVERWRMSVALRTLAAHGGGLMVVSGHRGEAARLAELVPAGIEVVLESSARSTWENVERSLPWLARADRVAIATDRFHRRRAVGYLTALAPDLVGRLVDPVYALREGALMDAGGAVYEGALSMRRMIRRSIR